MRKLSWLGMEPGLGLALVLCLAMAVALPAADQKVSSPAAAPVQLTRCRIKLIDEVTLASGRTGVLKFVHPKEGDSVKKDEEVAGLLDDSAQAAFTVAEKEASNDIEIRYAQAATLVAETEFEKNVLVNKRTPGAVPDVELKKLKLAADRSRLQIEQAEHQFSIAKLKRDEAKANLKLYHINAPFDAIVTRVYKQKGEAVREGDPILELSSTARVRVEGYVNIKEVWNLKQGAPVRVQLDIPEAELDVEKLTFEGQIVFVDVRVQPVTGEVRVWAEVINKENVLRAGLTAKMIINPAVPPAQAARVEK